MTVTERREHWRGLLTEQAASGLSAAAFCREKNLAVKKFYSWHRRLTVTAASATGGDGGFVELVPTGGGENGSGVTLQVGARLSIRLEKGFDPATLRAALVALADGAPCFH